MCEGMKNEWIYEWVNESMSKCQMSGQWPSERIDRWVREWMKD